jgi:hypothetical protein
MSKFLRALERAGLVKLEGTDVAAVEIPEVAPQEQNAALEVPANTAVPEHISFDSLYARAGVAASPFPAEKLLKLLDGLRAMDSATRKSAVMAMDAADDAWTIDDCLLDAERKCAALLATKKSVESQVKAAESATAKAVADLEKSQEETSAAVRRQIADLEGLMQREVERVANERAAVMASAREARAAGQREALRIDGEIDRLQEISRIFSSTKTP